MPSSTSNSRVIPDVRWGATWIVALAIVVGAAVALELFARGRGYQPSVKDDDYGWAWQRGRVDGSPHAMAVLGASRIQLAFSADAFRDVLPDWRAVQLAIDGTQPAGSLRDLAEDPEFRGVALVETTEDGFYAANRDRQDAPIAAYHRRYRAPGAMAERWLATIVQSHVALVSAAGLRALASLAGGHGWPKPPYVVTHADRTQFADFALADLATQKKRQIGRIGTPVLADEHTWLSDALGLEPYVDAIRARGGRVVYLRMPTCDERWAADELATPKARFWDQLAARTHAIAIHFRDEPTLREFPCPDMSHIASKDGPRFTRALLAILASRGAFAQ